MEFLFCEFVDGSGMMTFMAWINIFGTILGNNIQGISLEGSCAWDPWIPSHKAHCDWSLWVHMGRSSVIHGTMGLLLKGSTGCYWLLLILRFPGRYNWLVVLMRDIWCTGWSKGMLLIPKWGNMMETWLEVH